MKTPIAFKKFDQVGKIISYENGELDHADTIDLFQHMINNGTVWHLQGSYQRTAYDLIRAGECVATPKVGF